MRYRVDVECVTHQGREFSDTMHAEGRHLGDAIDNLDEKRLTFDLDPDEVKRFTITVEEMS